MVDTDDGAGRLTFGDDVFVRRHRGLGSPVVNQLIWRFDRALPPHGVLELRDALADGALARRVDRPLVPGARARWSRVEERPPVIERTEALAEHEVMTWVQGLVATPLDPRHGSAWRLASAPTTDGGTIVSLVLSHAVADGGAMIDAVERATAQRPPLRLPDRLPAFAGLVDDARDAARQAVAVGRWLVRARPTARGGATKPVAASTPPRPVDTDERWRAPVAVVECRTDDITAAAARLGGTPNAWFVAVASSLVTPPDGPSGAALRVALPVSARGADDRRANATRIASVTIDPQDLGTRDLARVRAACKAAYSGLGDPTASEPSMLALVQMLPDAALRRVPQPPAATVLASNLGDLSDSFCTIAGVRARSVAALAGLQDATTADLRAMGGGLMAWTATCGDRTTISVAALDPDGVTDDTALGERVRTVLSAWDVVEAVAW